MFLVILGLTRFHAEVSVEAAPTRQLQHCGHRTKETQVGAASHALLWTGPIPLVPTPLVPTPLVPTPAPALASPAGRPSLLHVCLSVLALSPSVPLGGLIRSSHLLCSALTWCRL